MSGTHTFDCCPFCGGAITRGEDWPRVEDNWLFVADRRAKLQPTQARILQAILRRYPEQITFVDVFDAVWRGGDPRDETLRTHMSRLNIALRPYFALHSLDRRITLSRAS